MTIDGYIRVSRVAGREGDSFISPDVQREQIEAYAKAHGYEIAAWHTDLDQSGGKLDRPGLTEALARCRSGQTGGIVAAKLDRLSRSLIGLAHLIEQAREEGWTLVAVDFGLDVKKSSGKLVADVLGAVAEWELGQRREGWNEAQARAVARGVHVASRTPTGYRKRDDGRLEPDAKSAPVIRELFRRRGAGEGWTTLANVLDESGVQGPYGNGGWTNGAIQKIIRNRVYLGEARSGAHVNAEAHEAIVTRAEWEAAQGVRSGPSPRNGDGLLLSGLVRCAGCRYVVKPDTMRDRDGSRLGLYRCRVRHAPGRCSAPASVLARVLEPYVESVFFAALGSSGPLAEASAASQAFEDALRSVEEAERELSAYNETEAASLIGQAAFLAGLGVRAAKLEQTRSELALARDRTPLTLPAMGDLVEDWPALTIVERRRLLSAAIDGIFVRASRGSGRQVPIEERVVILWRGEAPDDLPRRGRRVPLAPLAWPDDRPGDVGMPST